MVETSQTSGFWPQLYEPFRTMGARLSDWLAPAAEAMKDDNAYVIAIELPGVEDKDIELSVENGVMSVKGEKRSSREDKGETWYFSERQFGLFQRTFRLPVDADETAVSADLKHGVLTVTVPKIPEKAKAIKTVKIKTG